MSLQAQIYRGISNFNLGLVPEATLALETVRQLSGDPQVLLYLGLCYYSQQDWRQASEVLEESTRKDPSLVDGFLYLGYSFVNQGNSMEAALNFTKALNLDPHNEAANQGLMSLG